MEYLLIALAGAAMVAGSVFAWRRIHAARSASGHARAMSDFESLRDQLAAEFFHVAATSGKPRGLRWTSCELNGKPLFGRELATGQLYALVPVTISFEAIAGGGMEEVEAVGNLRSATAVFVNRGQEWSTDGRVIFNLEPAESLKRFDKVLEPLLP